MELPNKELRMLDKIFSWSKKKPEEEHEPDPDIIFGRYSDNNKSVAKVEKWTTADTLFKQKRYHESISAFFEYLSDDEIQNVVHKWDGEKGEFYFFQGSKIIRGKYDNDILEAEALLAADALGVGSMKPKVEAAAQLVREGGTRAVIASLHDAARAVAGEAGTSITA